MHYSPTHNKGHSNQNLAAKNCCDILTGKTDFWIISIGNLDNYLAINEGTVSNAQSEAVIQPF